MRKEEEEEDYIFPCWIKNKERKETNAAKHSQKASSDSRH